MDLYKNDHLQEGNIDDALFEDPIMQTVDNMIEEDEECEDSLLFKDFNYDPELIDLVDVETARNIIATGSYR